MVTDNYEELPPSCNIWTNKNAVSDSLKTFLYELELYQRLIRSFKGVSDLRKALRDTDTPSERERICQRVELHKDGLPGIFPSGVLSKRDSFGLLEPLLPPFGIANSVLTRSICLIQDIWCMILDKRVAV